MAHGEKWHAFIERLKLIFTKVDAFILDHIDEVIKVTTGLKNFIESPVIDAAETVLDKIIPHNVTEEIRKKIEDGLDKAIDALNIIQTCESLPLEEKIKCYIEHVKDFKPAMQHAILSKIGSLVTAHIDENKQPEHVYDTVFQQKYSSAKPM